MIKFSSMVPDRDIVSVNVSTWVVCDIYLFGYMILIRDIGGDVLMVG